MENNLRSLGYSSTGHTASPRSWEALTPPLAEWILDAVSSMGFREMTQVQASVIPLFNGSKGGNKDVVVEAVTGSGKTLAYLIPVIERLLRLDERTKKHHVASIIISPTRELATQIHGVLKFLLGFHGPSSAVLRELKTEGDDNATSANTEQSVPTYPPSSPVIVPQLLIKGDTTVAQDLSLFLRSSPNLLIATPGRLLELLSSPHVHCPQSTFEVLVLDEADRLLDLGFKTDIQKILGRLPKQRRTGLFSASVSEAVDQIVRVGLRNPVKVLVKVRSLNGESDGITPSSLQMSYVITPASHKLSAVSKILSSQPTPHKTILYLSTCAAVEYFQYVLPSILPTPNGQKFKINTLHGKKLAKVRQRELEAFACTSAPSILLTTDVAARGLDISQVDLVLQVDPPNDPKDFLHRCGRAGRAGRKGMSILLLQPGREEDYINFLKIRRTPVTPLHTPNVETSCVDALYTTESIRRTVLTDRAHHDRAQRGFVSWVQAYSKHQLSSIFRVPDLDWEDLGNAWGLLKLPKMPELKKWEGDKSLGVKIEWDTYAYKDKMKEEQRKESNSRRQEALAKAVSTPHPEKRQVKRAWSNKIDAQEERDVRRTKRHRTRERERLEKMTGPEREKHLELVRLIEEMKAKRAEEEQYGDFNGFSD